MHANAPSAADIREFDNRNHVHPWHPVGIEDADFMIATEGEGIHLFDTEGRKYIDGPAGMWSTQIGYGRREMADAIAEQEMKLPFMTHGVYWLEQCDFKMEILLYLFMETMS